MNILEDEVTLPLWVLVAIGLLSLLAIATTSRTKSRQQGDTPDANSNEKSGVKQYGITDAPFKMLLCVNTSLGMGKGKIAAQCGHAALGAYKHGLKSNRSGVECWEYTGCAKIAVKVNDEEMKEMESIAKNQGLVSYVVRDAGRTQIAAGSRTVLAIGPAPVSEMKFTNHLKLL
jgi:PTH2 family peptidyl-tRNA hydrolase